MTNILFCLKKSIRKIHTERNTSQVDTLTMQNYNDHSWPLKSYEDQLVLDIILQNSQGNMIHRSDENEHE